MPPSSRQVTLAGQSSADLFKKAIRGLLGGGYEIKSQDQSSGLIQAFRPMRGSFMRPGYGHNVTITIDSGSFTVKAFPMAGVIGGETPDQIRDEVIIEGKGDCPLFLSAWYVTLTDTTGATASRSFTVTYTR